MKNLHVIRQCLNCKQLSSTPLDPGITLNLISKFQQGENPEEYIKEVLKEESNSDCCQAPTKATGVYFLDKGTTHFLLPPEQPLKEEP